ncbi:FMN-binding protein [Mollicutes bacterium LVI A0039]|nr:FMN-binding protein [Mollicutes bacterium LVI A0039]
MKKLLSVSALTLVLLAGCSSSASYAGQSAVSSEENHVGEYATVTFDKDGDDISNVQFDVVLPEGEYTSKKALSDAGEYGMEEKTGKSWTAHVNDLENYINENDKFPALDAEGKDVDGASGATISIDEFEEAFNAAEKA